MKTVLEYIIGHSLCVLLGLLYILLGIIQVVTLGLVKFHSLPDYRDFQQPKYPIYIRPREGR